MHYDLTPQDIERFWAKVDRSGGPDSCHPWIASCFKKNGVPTYGCFAVRPGVCRNASIIALHLATGEQPDGRYALHTCDFRRCCNPAHLYWGTQSQNMRDMVERNPNWKMPTAHLRGETNPFAALTDAQVAEIKARLKNGKRGIGTQLAAEYGVCKSTISMIKRGQTHRE